MREDSRLIISTMRPDEEAHLLVGSACVLRIDWAGAEGSADFEDFEEIYPPDLPPWRISKRPLIAEGWDVVTAVFSKLSKAGSSFIFYAGDEITECGREVETRHVLEDLRESMLDDPDYRFSPLQAWCIGPGDFENTREVVLRFIARSDDRWAWRAALARDAVHIRVTADSLSVASHCSVFDRVCTLLVGASDP